MITADDIRALIQENVMGVDAMTLGEGDNFKQAGIDSLDQINVLLAIEEKHGYKIPDEDVKLCQSIRSTLDYLAALK
jgi:acyl carrier protein